VRDGSEWIEASTVGAPRLVVGWRPRPRNLEAGRVELHEDAAAVLREVVAHSLSRLAGMTAVPYGPAVLPEANEEYLRIEIHELAPRRPSRRKVGPQRSNEVPATPTQDGTSVRPTDVLSDKDESPEIADLLRIVGAPDDLPVISAGQLRESDFSFSAICLPQQSGEVITTVRGVSPTRILRRAAFFGRFSGSLRNAERPDLLLEQAVDLVITRDEIAVLNRTNFDRLFSDLDAVALAVPGNVESIQRSMPNLPFAPGTAATLTVLCQRLPSLAKRLAALSRNPALSVLSPDTLRNALSSHGEDAGHWLDQTDSLSLSEDRARQFLDVVEGRWWTSDFSQEKRRADRYRAR
jgi:hypothetical protein